jgi:hypothetical protein
MLMNRISTFIRRVLSSSIVFMGIASAYAQRATQADIYGDTESGGSGFGGTIALLIFGALVVWGFISNRGFRLGILAYVGFIGGIILIFREFGKEAGIAACVVAILVLLVMDKNNRIK